MLAIVHVSSRYNVSAVLGEARDVFPNTVAPRDFDLVEVPFPERGDPELIQGGAKQRPEPQAEDEKDIKLEWSGRRQTIKLKRDANDWARFLSEIILSGDPPPPAAATAKPADGPGTEETTPVFPP